MLPHHKVTGHNLLHGVGGEGVDAGQVHNGHVPAIHMGHALLLLHRHAGPVAHILVGPGEGVEEGGFAAVGVAHQGNFHLPHVVVVLLAAPVLPLMVLVGLGHPPHCLLVGGGVLGTGAVGLLPRGTQEDVAGVLLAQRQLIPPEIDLDGVAKGGNLPHRHFGAGGQPHIYQPTLHRAPGVVDGPNDTGLTRLQLL